MAAKGRGVHPKVTIERAYYRALKRGYVDPYLRGLFDALQALGDLATHDQVLSAVAKYDARWRRDNPLNADVMIAGGVAGIAGGAGVSGDVGRAVLTWLDRSARSASAELARDVIRVAKVDIRPQLQFVDNRSLLEQFAAKNIRLIETIHPRGASEMEKQVLRDLLTKQLVEGEKAAPLDREAREAMFRKTAKSTGYNLRRITRDQSNKLTGQLNRANQMAAGFTHFRWQTADDDRVRPTHAVKDGMIFDWETAPDLDTGIPGNDIQCRCVGVAHFE